MTSESQYMDRYVFSKQGGGGGVPLFNAAILTTSLLIGGKSNVSQENVNLGTELFVPGGLVYIPDNAFQETRECVSTDPYHVPVMDLFDDLLELVEVRNIERKKTKTMTTRKLRIRQ